MTKEDYLKQPEKLNKSINSSMLRVSNLKKQACSISAPQLKEHVHSSFNTDAPFEKMSIMIMDMERMITAKIDLLVDLNRQIDESLEAMEDDDERMAIQCRILQKYTWEKTSAELNVSISQAKRIYGDGMKHYQIPFDAIEI